MVNVQRANNLLSANLSWKIQFQFISVCDPKIGSNWKILHREINVEN